MLRKRHIGKGYGAFGSFGVYCCQRAFRGGREYSAAAALKTAGGKRMFTFRYQVESIDGDYANLRRIDGEDEDLKLVARALLPPEIREGTKLLYEMMQYTVIEEGM